MSRLIDADALVETIRRVYCAGCDSNMGERCRACGYGDVLDWVEDAPTIDPESLRPVGRWERSEYNGFLRCSACEVTHINEDWLVDDKWNLVDWPDNLRDNYDFPLTSVIEKGLGPHNVVNAFYIGCVKQTEEIRGILGIEKAKKSDDLVDAFHKHFYNPETGLYTDSPNTKHSSLHSNSIVAFYGICKKEEEATIREFIMEKRLCCGVYMAYFVLKALCRMGYYEDAYKLIVSEDEHSWYNMVREGATTCFEAWGKEQKWNTSLCHPWASGPISVLAEDILPNIPEIGKLIIRK